MTTNQNDPFLKVSLAEVDLVQQRQALAAEIDKLQEELDLLDARLNLKVRMEERGALICVHRQLRLAELQAWKKKIHDGKRLTAERPDIAAEYKKESTGNTLKYTA